MSRTFRNPVYEYNYFRHPKTQGERKKLDGFIRDSVFEEFSISGINHAHHRLNRIPTSYDDVGFSARLRQTIRKTGKRFQPDVVCAPIPGPARAAAKHLPIP